MVMLGGEHGQYAGAGKLQITTGSQTTEWLVFDTSAQACSAAEELSGEAAKDCKLQKDTFTRIGYWPILQMRRHISLDDDEFHAEVGRLTWFSELEDALVSEAVKSSNVGQRLRDGMRRNDTLCLAAQSGASGIVWEGLPPEPGNEQESAAHQETPNVADAHKNRKVLSNKSKPEEHQGEGYAKKNPTVIWGEVFIQKEGLGYASYHFERGGEAYISYAKTKPGWVHDDGSKYPKKKYFTNVSYDAQLLTLKGIVDWSPKTVKGAERWVYDMIFDQGLTRISGGTIRFYGPGTGASSAPLQVAHFGKQVEYKRKSALDEALAADEKRIDPQTKQIINIIGETLGNYDKATGGERPSPQKTLQLVFGDSMQTFVRDVEADRRGQRR